MGVRSALMEDAVVKERRQPLRKLCERYKNALLAAHVIIGLLIDQSVVNARTVVDVIVKIRRSQHHNLQRLLHL